MSTSHQCSLTRNNNPISSTTLEVKEGTGVRNIGMVLATDPDGDPLTYTLDTASDALFSIPFAHLPVAS